MLAAAVSISFTDVLFDKSGKFHIVSSWHFIMLIGGHWQDVRGDTRQVTAVIVDSSKIYAIIID